MSPWIVMPVSITNLAMHVTEGTHKLRALEAPLHEIEGLNRPAAIPIEMADSFLGHDKECHVNRG